MTEKDFDSKNHAKEWIIRNQFGRRNLIPFQKADLALTLENVVTDIKEKAKENQLSTLKQGTVFQHTGKREAVHTDKELAKIAGVSHDTVWRVEKIQEKATPEEKEELQKGSISVHMVHTDKELAKIAGVSHDTIWKVQERIHPGEVYPKLDCCPSFSIFKGTFGPPILGSGRLDFLPSQ